MTLYIGLIGGGNISKRTRTRAPAPLPELEIVAIHGMDGEKIAGLCREHGGMPYQMG
jgi:predicted dehydrogenase